MKIERTGEMEEVNVPFFHLVCVRVGGVVAAVVETGQIIVEFSLIAKCEHIALSLSERLL